MGLSRRSLFHDDTLEIRAVACRPRNPDPGGAEYSEKPTLVLPSAGTFRLHLGHQHAFVLDPTQALFLPPGEPHRYSHPVPGGDDCLAIELPSEQLSALLDGLDPAAADRGVRPYRTHRVVLPPRALLARQLLQHRLLARTASALEVDETVSELVRSWVAAGESSRPPAPARTSTVRAHRDRVEAVQLHLAADLGRAWRLDELGRLVATSPCHLTTVFRRIVGVPIHRHLLRLRLARALEEVVSSRRELTAIGADLGFSTPSHFAASFRCAFGRPPVEVRREAGSRPSLEPRKISTAHGDGLA